MQKIRYVHETTFNEARLREVLALDALVYPRAFQGSYASVSARYQQNTEMFIFALDSDDNLCGYICFFSLSATFSTKLHSENTIIDDNIAANDVLAYKKGGFHDIYIISLVVAPAFQNQGVATTLLTEMFNFLERKIRGGYAITNIFATTITKQSEHLFKQYQFRELRSYKLEYKLLTVKL